MKMKYPYTLLLFFTMSVVYLGYWLGPLMVYREGFALFLFDSTYALNMLTSPSGSVDYITQFISQFLLYPWLGAFLLASLLTYIVWGSSKWIATHSALNFIVPIWLIGLLSNLTFDLRTLISIVIVVIAAQSTIWIKKTWWSAIVVVLMTLISPPWGVVLTMMLIAACIPRLEHKKSCFSYLSILLITLFVSCAAEYWLLYPNFSFHAIFTTEKALHIPLAIILILMPIVVRTTAKWFKKQTMVSIIIITTGMCLVVFYSSLDRSMRSILAMDSKIRKNDYKAVVDIARQQNNKLSRQHGFYVALAQVELGTMCTELYQFSQKWGSTVLYPEFSNDPLELFMTSELYSRLGHWNYAYRYAMEGVVINTRPSARMLSMMARAAIVNGEYELAEKYKNTLSSSLFYKNSTKEIETNITKIRQQMPLNNMNIGDGHNSYLFLSKAYQGNPNNRYVYEYLMSDIMLKGRLDMLIRYLPSAEKFYTTMPILYQQAIMVYWAKTGNNMELIDRYVTKEVQQEYTAFTQIMTSAANKPLAQREKMFEPYRNTYFYYITSDTTKK